MPSTKTTGSPNIAILDSKIITDLCAGKFFIDVTPSTFIGAGANNVLGVRIKVENPYHVMLKDYSVAYDIPSPLTSVYSFNIPTQAGAYQYGVFTITAQITDANGAIWEVSKDVTICEPNPLNKRSKTGIIYAKLSGLCNQGKMRVAIDNPPTYKGLISQSQESDYILKFPAGSGVVDKTGISASSFSVNLFDGTYILSGDMCALYIDKDNVSYKVKYLLNIQKDIRCSIDECCIFQKLSELNKKVLSDCTNVEKEQTASIILDVLRLLETAKLASGCGEDASEYITQLEEILQCRCTVAAQAGVPLYNNAPTGDWVIEGCNVEKEIVGLTTIYRIDNFEYIIDVTPNGGALVSSVPQLGENCTKTQVLTFDIGVVYSQIKNLANANALEADAWSSIINKVLNNLNVVSLGLTSLQWLSMTFAQRIQAIINKIGACCDCNAKILTHSSSVDGDDVIVHWTSENTFAVDVYLDSNYITTVLAPTTQAIFINIANGANHTYVLIPKCSTNKEGQPVTGDFNFYGCPYIAPPNLSTMNANQVPCPYDLTALITTLPNGITAEWHNQNNTLVATRIPTPSAVSTGTYYVFAKNANGCYSEGVQVVVICQSGQCSAPQDARVVTATGGFLVSFVSAGFPPPSNSYTVKRRLTSDPDVSASYTIIGSTGSGGIQFNAASGRWEILDNTALNNIIYTYVVISNCGATAPYVSVEFSNFTSCPIITGLSASMQ